MIGITFFLIICSIVAVTSAQSTSSLCPSANGRIIYDTHGAGYLVTCAADNDRGSYNNTQAVSSYLDCMTTCDEDTVKPCIGFTYVGGNGGKGSGTCWLKNKLTTYPSKAGNVISAVRVSNVTDQDVSSSIRSSSVSSTAVPQISTLRSSAVGTSQAQSTLVRSSSAAPSASAALGNLCPSYNFTTYADDEDNNWQVLCGFDTSPSSFDVINVSNFALCLEACNKEDGCVAVSYFGTACYFKNDYRSLTPSRNVNSAFIINKADYPVPSRSNVYSSRGCGSALPAGIMAGGSTTQLSINSGGLRRHFSVHVPTSYNINGGAAPLLFAFHGRSETPANIEGYSDLSNEAFNPYGIVVYPSGIAANSSDYPQWAGDPDTVNRVPYVDDQMFVQDPLVHMTSNYCIDTSRIIAIGFSNGGGFTDILACNSTLSNQFSAFAVNAGAFYTNSSETSRCTGDVPSNILTNTLVQPVCSPGRTNLPILEFHGDADGTILYTGGPRRGYCLPSILHWASDCSVRNGYSDAYVSTPLANGQVTKYEYGTGDNQGIVIHYKIAGWKHAWVRDSSGAPIDSTPIIMDFLYRFTNPNALRFIPSPASLPTISSSRSASGPASSTSTLTSLSSPASVNSTNISLPFNISTSIAISLTTTVSTVSLNVSLPWNASIVNIASATPYFNSSTILPPGTAVSTSTFSTLPTLAPFANATASENATSPTTAPTISCPASDGTLYRDPTTGWTFEIECNDDNTATVDLVNSSAITVNGASLQDCIRFCAMMVPACQGVTMSSDGGICYLERSSAIMAGPHEQKIISDVF
ncbi:hypothetical protein E4T47_09016 [Aureobasidium subglaciale]|nr:hypothetical protein E4T47_09016 [Aureobasidium subglaciale]